jgi:hypothetical protein
MDIETCSQSDREEDSVLNRNLSNEAYLEDIGGSESRDKTVKELKK